MPPAERFSLPVARAFASLSQAAFCALAALTEVRGVHIPKGRVLASWGLETMRFFWTELVMLSSMKFQWFFGSYILLYVFSCWQPSEANQLPMKHILQPLVTMFQGKGMVMITICHKFGIRYLYGLMYGLRFWMPKNTFWLLKDTFGLLYLHIFTTF